MTSSLVSRQVAPLSKGAKNDRHRRRLLEAAYSQLEAGFVARYIYARPWRALTVQERMSILAAMANDLRGLADQMETARRELAAEELSA